MSLQRNSCRAVVLSIADVIMNVKGIMIKKYIYYNKQVTMSCFYVKQTAALVACSLCFDSRDGADTCSAMGIFWLL